MRRLKPAVQTGAEPGVVLVGGGTGLSHGQVGRSVLGRGSRVYLRTLTGAHVPSWDGSLSISRYNAIVTTCELLSGAIAESHCVVCQA